MAERYKRLNTYEPRYSLLDSPVEVIKGAILFDSVKNTVILQIRLCNNSCDNLLAVHIEIECLDETGQPLNDISLVEFTYRDIYIKPHCVFGEKIPIPLSNINVRYVNITLKKAVFENGKVIELSNLKQIENPQYETIDSLDKILFNKLKRISSIGDNSDFPMQFIPINTDNYWSCTCGKVNSNTEQRCLRCYRDKELLFSSFDSNQLKQSLLKHKRKIKTVSIIAGLIVSLIIILFLVLKLALPQIKYNTANEYLHNNKIQEAIAIFSEIPDYKDSSDLILTARCKQVYNDIKKDRNSLIDNKNLKDINEKLLLNRQSSKAKDEYQKVVELIYSASYDYAETINIKDCADIPTEITKADDTRKMLSNIQKELVSDNTLISKIDKLETDLDTVDQFNPISKYANDVQYFVSNYSNMKRLLASYATPSLIMASNSELIARTDEFIEELNELPPYTSGEYKDEFNAIISNFITSGEIIKKGVNDNTVLGKGLNGCLEVLGQYVNLNNRVMSIEKDFAEIYNEIPLYMKQ